MLPELVISAMVANEYNIQAGKRRYSLRSNPVYTGAVQHPAQAVLNPVHFHFLLAEAANTQYDKTLELAHRLAASKDQNFGLIVVYFKTKTISYKTSGRFV